MIKIFVVINIGLLFFSCHDDGLARYIDFYNESGRAICYYLPWTDGVFYPDTVLPEKDFNPQKFNNQTSYNFGNPGMNEDQLFLQMPVDTLSIFFFDPDTLAKYNWESISRENKILVRYDFSHADLRYLKWCIRYPPTKAMKNMKMYPPYKEE